MQNNPERDPVLWEIAQKRASFKWNLASYIIVNTFLWLLWYFTGNRYGHESHVPWPVWPTLGWGIGIVFHYLGAYVFPKQTSAETEYEKLLRSKQNKH